MKDSEFIALLNLYVDHEIGAEDSARLEAAVAGDPERRRIYRQYCQMQKACSLLAQEQRASEPEEVAFAAGAENRVRRGYSAAVWLGGLAAAAGIAALVAVNTVNRAVPAARPAATLAAAGRTAQPAPSAQPTFALQLQAPSAPGVSTDLAWMKTVQFAPLQQISPDKILALDSKDTLESDNQAVADRPASQDAVNTTAFQFQR